MTGSGSMHRVGRPVHRVRRLDNGLTVLVIEDSRVPALSLSLMVPGGAAADEAGEAGLAALAAGLLNRGSRRRDADALAVAVDSLGASYSSRTGRDHTLVSLSGLAEDTPELMALLAEIATEPIFPASEFEIMRQRRLHALARSMDQAAVVADWSFADALYGDHPYGRPLAGGAPAVSGLGAGAPAAWHARRFTPDGAWLAVAGAVRAEEVFPLVSGCFGAWAGASPPLAAPPAPASAGRRLRLVDRPDLSQAQIRWGHVGLARADRRHDPAELVNDVLGGGGFSSRLMQEIRSRKGLTYGIHSGFDARLWPGPFTVSTYTPTAKVLEVLEDVERLVAAFRATGPTEVELDGARRRLVGGYPLQFETSTQVAGHLLEEALYGLPGDDLETYQDRIMAVDTATGAALAAELFKPSDALVVIVGDQAKIGPLPPDLGPAEEFDARTRFGRSGTPAG